MLHYELLLAGPGVSHWSEQEAGSIAGLAIALL